MYICHGLAHSGAIFTAMNGLDMEIQFLPGVGPKRAALLQKELGVSTVGDLLRLYPFRYIDRSSVVRIADARPDMAYLQIRRELLAWNFSEILPAAWTLRVRAQELRRRH